MNPDDEHRKLIRTRLLEFVPDIHTLKTELSIAQRLQWNTEFETLRLNRMLMGCFRYGSRVEVDNSHLDYVESIKRRIKMYEKTGNAEHLIDVANLAELEFTYSQRKAGQYFNAEDADKRIGVE
jgi:hypothetical protein